MKKKALGLITIVLIIVVECISFAGCMNQPTINEAAYWFSEYTTEFIKYDDSVKNIEDAGKFWKMTVKKDCNVSIGFINNVSGMYSSTAFYVNDTQVKSEVGEIFTYYYKNLNLKAGDKIVIHAFSLNSLEALNEEVKMEMFTIINSEGNYPINDIK